VRSAVPTHTAAFAGGATLRPSLLAPHIRLASVAAHRSQRPIRASLRISGPRRRHARSDIDVLVVMRDASLDRVVDLEAKLTAATSRRLDIVRLDEAVRQPSFLADVTAVGRVLVDRDGAWPRLRSREARLRREARIRDSQDVEAALAGVDELLKPGANG